MKLLMIFLPCMCFSFLRFVRATVASSRSTAKLVELPSDSWLVINLCCQCLQNRSSLVTKSYVYAGILLTIDKITNHLHITSRTLEPRGRGEASCLPNLAAGGRAGEMIS